MARFFKTTNGVHINVDRVSRARVNEAGDTPNEKRFAVLFVFENYTEGVDHHSREEAEAELAAFLEFANLQIEEQVADALVSLNQVVDRLDTISEAIRFRNDGGAR